MKPRQNPSLAFVLYTSIKISNICFSRIPEIHILEAKKINKSWCNTILHFTIEKILHELIKFHKVQKVVIIMHIYWRKTFKWLN